MSAKTLVVRKSFLYTAVVGFGFLIPLIGDRIQPSAPAPAATSRPAAEPVEINPDDWQSLATAIKKQAKGLRGASGYVVKDLRTGQVVESNSDYVFPSASLIKLPILCAAYQAAEEGRLSLNTAIILQRSDRRGGSGVLKWANAGAVYTNRELLDLMITHSDNTAAELIVRQLGYDYLQRTFVRLGLQDTAIHPEGFKLSSRPVRQDNMTSPRDMALLLSKIYQRDLVTPEASDEMLAILKHQKLRDRLPKFLPQGWEIAHKTGLLRKACHDVGIVFSPKGDYMICVLTANERTYRSAKRFIADVARITFTHYQGGVHRPILQSKRVHSDRQRTS